MQETTVPSLVQTPPAAEQLSLRATTAKPTRCNCWNLHTWGQYSSNKRSHRNKKPARSKQVWPFFATTRKSPGSNKDSPQPKDKLIFFFFFLENYLSMIFLKGQQFIYQISTANIILNSWTIKPFSSKLGKDWDICLHVITQQCFQRFYQIRQENEVPSINIGKESMKLLFPDSSKPPPHPFGFFHAKYLKIII